MGMGYGKNSDVFGVGVISYNLYVLPPQQEMISETGTSLSAWSPWKARNREALIQETARAALAFPSGAFAGVSEEGAYNPLESDVISSYTLNAPKVSTFTSEVVHQTPFATSCATRIS